MSDPVLLTRAEGAVQIIELNRPRSKNALNRALVRELGDALARAAEDKAIRAVVLTGAGGAFCSGADLKASFEEDPDMLSHLDVRIDEFHRMIRAITSATKPFVAAVDGAAVGFGCDLALACDLRLVSPGGYFQEKFVKIGLMPDGGGTFFLSRLVGTARAFEIIYGGEPVTGEDSVRLGIANRLVPAERLVQEAIALAQKLAKGPPIALAKIKQAVWQSAGGTLDEALEREKTGQMACLQSGDAMEGILAWTQKREPDFQGR